jgi:hypothetical protein
MLKKIITFDYEINLFFSNIFVLFNLMLQLVILRNNELRIIRYVIKRFKTIININLLFMTKNNN